MPPSVVRILATVSVCLLTRQNAVAQTASVPLKPLWTIRDDEDKIVVEKPNQVRMSGATSWISDDGRLQLIHVDATGKVLGTAGRKGSGPGEFQRIGWFGIGVNDSLYVWDDQLRRVSVFSSDGKFKRTEVLENGASQPAVFGRMRNGDWLISTARSLNEQALGLSRDSVDINVAKSMHDVMRRLFTVPGRKMVAAKEGDGVYRMDLPAGSMIGLTGCDAGIVVAVGESRSVRAYDPQGKLLREVIMKDIGKPWDVAARTQAIESYSSSAPQPMREAIRKEFEKHVPNPMMHNPQFKIGRDGRIWAGSYDEPYPMTIVKNDGSNAARALFPMNFVFTEQDLNSAVGIQYLPDGKSVQRFELPLDVRGVKDAPNALHPTLGRCETGSVR
ncbi:MAG: 6-bladed beta-propeller [Gemmatimonadaceae bacterium]